MLPIGLVITIKTIKPLRIAWRRRLEIDDEALRVIEGASVRSVRMDEMSGLRISYRDRTRSLVLFARPPATKSFSFALLFEREHEIMELLKRHVTDLDAMDLRKELEAIYHNDLLGSSPEEKAAHYRQAKVCCAIANWLSIVIMLAALVWPYLYESTVWALVGTNLSGLLLLWHFDGVALLLSSPKSAYPSIGLPVFGPGILMAAMAAMRWNVLEWSAFWLPFATVFLVNVILVGTLARKYWVNKWASVPVLICALYAYGETISVSAARVNGETVCYFAAITGKHTLGTKRRNYYLHLGPWGPHKNPETVQVDSALYKRYNPGDTATITVRKGGFGIPFFDIR